MWDVITRDKSGVPKEHRYADLCKRIALHSDGSTAASSAATEHAKHEGPFRRFAEDILTNELTQEQMDNPEYWLRTDRTITKKQRSLINTLVRKNLRDGRVLYYIFEHGVPELLDPPLLRETPKREVVQKMLEEFMTWHASLL